jgi:hypothetical protein
MGDSNNTAGETFAAYLVKHYIGREGFGRHTIERLMRTPRVADAELRQPQIALARERFPLLTVALLVVLTALFGCELLYGVGPWSGLLAPSIQTLVALGGSNQTLVLQSGEWQRIFSAILLHADALHLALNGFCLYLAGTMLESSSAAMVFRPIRDRGVCGSLMSLASIRLQSSRSERRGPSWVCSPLRSSAAFAIRRAPCACRSR